MTDIRLLLASARCSAGAPPLVEAAGYRLQAVDFSLIGRHDEEFNKLQSRAGDVFVLIGAAVRQEGFAVATRKRVFSLIIRC